MLGVGTWGAWWVGSRHQQAEVQPVFTGHCAGVFLLEKEVWALYFCAYHVAMSHAFLGVRK